MTILKIIEALQSYSEDVMAYKLDGGFSNAVTEAVSLLISQGEQIADLQNELRDERYRHDRVQDFEVAEAEELRKLKEAQRWIPVTELLPESNKAVLISARCKTFGFRHTLKAAHIGHHEATTEDYGWQEYEGDTEYDEEKDCFWIPECWWEDNFAEGNINWIIDSDCEVTHWMPLPEPPKEISHDE